MKMSLYSVSIWAMRPSGRLSIAARTPSSSRVSARQAGAASATEAMTKAIWQITAAARAADAPRVWAGAVPAGRWSTDGLVRSNNASHFRRHRRSCPHQSTRAHFAAPQRCCCPSFAATLALYLGLLRTQGFAHAAEPSCCALLVLLAFASFAPDAGAQERRVPTSPAEVRLSYAPVVQRVAPAVVNVYAAKMVANRNPLFDDPIFRRFFGVPGVPGGRRADAALARLRRHRRSRPASSSPTTTSSKAPTEVKVSLADKREFEAEIVLKDARSDLAVLRIKAPGERFPALEFADSDALQVGDVVLAIGNPFARRPDRDPRHRLGGGAHAGRHHRLSVLHPDRRRHQSRQFRRRAGRSRAASWSASTPRSSRARAARRASALPFPPTWCGWWSPRRKGGGSAVQAAVARRAGCRR